MRLFLPFKVQLHLLVLTLFLSTLSSCAERETQSQTSAPPSQSTAEKTESSLSSQDAASWSIILTDPEESPQTSSPSSIGAPDSSPQAPASPSRLKPGKTGQPQKTKPQGQAAPKRNTRKQKVAFSRTPYAVIDEAKKDQFNVTGEQIFSNSTLPNHQVDFNEADLLAVLINVKTYFESHSQNDSTALREGILGTGGVTVQDIQDTLAFMINTLEQDIALQRPSRLKDPNFLNTHFQVVKWQPYNPQQPDQNQLRITKYAVFAHQGSRTKTAEFDTPIYQLKPEYAVDKFFQNYSKQEVLTGIYETGGKEQGKVTPLAYLTRQGLEDALLQGTILIRFGDGSSAYFNVDRNNGIAYVRGQPQREQKRYWYFKQVDAIKGYGPKTAKIAVRPGVTFAGDVLNIGLGKIIMLEHNTGGTQQLNMGVLADTGGAFLPNLYQLDFLAGVFPSHDQFKQHISTLPAYANAYILIKKKS
ncbi:murein transglycosylase A family protein [Acaryochloris marina]|uniref:POLO box domain-containing protein n=1 Tax=Acaryochloris marina (strain MBIC 11017) TaxID=329726 RepID=B0C236_ACAM1|nr:hypothetical protein [Acaryochloris marina]ABW27337.1 conserved hypothetical protein [Acaryochloris marina MBIC11017]